MKQTLTFEVDLDENHLPLSIDMYNGKKELTETGIKSLMVSAWASKSQETLRIDLWTKDMPVHDMFIMYHQTMMSMARSLEKATGEENLAGALRDYCEFFAEKTNIK